MLAIFEGTFFAILVVYACAVVALPLSDRLLPRQHLLLRALRQREPESLLLCLLAVGLASGVKLTAVPFAAATVVALLWSVIAHADNRARRIRMFGVGCMAGLLIVTPWLVSNLMDTGFPLRMPMTVAGLQLGAENAAFTWYQDRVLSAYTLRAEFDALAKLFPLPNVNELHLSALTLPAFLLALVGFFQLFRTRSDLRGGLLLTLALCGAILMAFYHSSFSVGRSSPRRSFTSDSSRPCDSRCPVRS